MANAPNDSRERPAPATPGGVTWGQNGYGGVIPRRPHQLRGVVAPHGPEGIPHPDGQGRGLFQYCGIIGTLPAQRNPDKLVNNRLAPTGNHGPGQKGEA